MAGEMRALTVKQLWAGCIAHLDKRVENRPKRFPPALLGQPIAIHAGLSVDKSIEWPGTAEQHASLFASPAEWDAWRYWILGRKPRDETNWPAKLPLGAVVAVATITGSHWHEPRQAECGDGSYAYGVICSRWARPFCWHWQLADVRPLPEPVPCKGDLGLWRLPEDVEKAVRAQLSEDGNHA